MYTLDGRMRFNLPLAEADELHFCAARLREIVLLSSELCVGQHKAPDDRPRDWAGLTAWVIEAVGYLREASQLLSR